MNVETIPAELRERPQWVVWRFEERDGKKTKVPYHADDWERRASSTKAETWAPFQVAYEAVAIGGVADGIGYVFAADDPYVGIDLDGAMSDDDRAAIIRGLNSYTETSVSGNGVHVIVRAHLNGHARNRKGPFEVYERGRYFVVTGDHVEGTPATIEERQTELEGILATFLPPPAPPARPAEVGQGLDVDDEGLLERAFAARNGGDVERLYRGDTTGYPSQSEADLALASALAFWTGADHARLDGLFRRSGLMREKWDSRRGESTYGATTIAAAIDSRSEFYSARPAAQPPRVAADARDEQPADRGEETIQDATLASERARTVDGWTFVKASHETVPAIWGEGDAVLWAQGEPFMLVGPDGVGKTSVGQQLSLARLKGGKLLGLPVGRAAGKVLYIAADRPAQAARSMRRMVTDDDEQLLRDRLVVHRGPLPFDIVKEPPWTLREWIQKHEGVTDVVIDSLKDLAPKLVDDEVGGAVNRAFQEVVASDLELAALHHQRKQQQNGKPPRALADVYGSRWLTAGMGSVALLWGEPGDLVVNFRHLKQPLEEVGPFDVLHDHVHGRTTQHDHTDLEQLLDGAASGLTCRDAARLIFSKDDPKPNDVEKARRRLETLISRNLAERRDDPDGLARYFTKAAA